MTDLSHLKLFATHPHPCSYLEGEEATTLFIDPQADIDQDIYSQLSQIGFRRSGNHLYRPHCEHCQACVSCRIPVHHFSPNRTQRRCWRRNNDLEQRFVDQIDTEEHYQLYADYIETRHRDGDMYPPSREQYQSFLSGAWNVTRYLEFRLEGRLLGVAVCDRLNEGLSAVYTFFDAREQRRSLGVFAILAQIELAKHLELKHLFLGYWVKQCQKMDYKTQYRPLELLTNRRWVRVN